MFVLNLKMCALYIWQLCFKKIEIILTGDRLWANNLRLRLHRKTKKQIDAPSPCS